MVPRSNTVMRRAIVSDERHVVLDHDQWVLAIDLADDLGRSHALFLGHAGGRFVEQDQIGPSAQHQRKLHPLPLAVCASWPTGLSAKRPRPNRSIWASTAASASFLVAWRAAAIQRFCRAVKSIEHARHLGLDADAEPGDFMGLQLGDVDTANSTTAPLVGLIWPVRSLKKVLLPAPFGPIRQRSSPSASEKSSVAEPPGRRREVFAQVARFDQRRAHALPSCAILCAAEGGRRRLSSQGTR